MATARTIHRVTGTGQTVGAVTVDLVTYDVPANECVLVELNVVGKNATPALTSQKRVASFKDVAGAVSLVDTVSTPHTADDAALAGASATLLASGANVIARATGIAAQTIDWYAEVTIWGN